MKLFYNFRKKTLTVIVVIFLITPRGFVATAAEVGLPATFTPLREHPSDNEDVFQPLIPSGRIDSEWVAYDEGHIPGISKKFKMKTSNENVYAEFSMTLLEQNPKITENMMQVVHDLMVLQGFVEERDSVLPINVVQLKNQGLKEKDVMIRLMNWEKRAFDKTAAELLANEEDIWGFNITLEIYPVFLDKKHVTYAVKGYLYQGGAHGIPVAFLRTFNRSTGRQLTNKDLIPASKMHGLKKLVVEHVAKNYSFDEVNSVEEYLSKSGAQWVMPEDDSTMLTIDNFPLPDGAITNFGLVFNYGAYELGPYAMGLPTVVITPEELRSIR